MFFKSKQFLVNFLFLFWNPVDAIKLYEGNKSAIHYDCNVQFEKSKEFDCACLSGVWKIYKSECEEIKTVGGLNYCFELPGDPIKRAEKILDSGSDISIRFPNGTLLPVREGTEISLDGKELFTTGADWSIIDSTGASSCFSPTTDNFCQFSLSAPVVQGKFAKGCQPTSSKAEAKNCETLQKTNDNICEKSRQAGRVFLPAPGFNDSVLIKDPSLLIPEDEDFYDKAKMVESRDEMLTEIWNFMDHELNEILAIRENTIIGKSRSSVFNILQLATNVMKKTCPEFYINPQFFDMATFVFVQMQRKAFKPADFPREYYAYQRIVHALETCVNNTKVFPFIDNFTCSDTGEPYGIYVNILNGTDELDAPFTKVPEKRDPIIETVWKIFYTAHSTCYQYFDESFNDHHRFTTWITPLFQNDINDLWTKGETPKDKIVLGNLFGDMLNIQTRIVYCSAYARLDSDYPWDLPIPKKMEPYPAAGATPIVPVGPPVPAGRRRRSIDQGAGGRCIAPIKLPKC